MLPNMCRFYLLVILFMLTSIPIGARAFPIKNNDLAFTIDVPEGFTEYNYLKPHSDARTRKFVQENTLYAFNKGGDPENNNYTGIFIYIERSSWVSLYGLDFGGLPANTELLSETWRGIKINLYRLERAYTTVGDRMVTLNATIPLKAEPIQIKLSGDLAVEKEMRELLSSMLASLEGKASIAAYANWLKALFITLAILAVVILFKRKLD